MKYEPKVGDWIRFVRDARLVIDAVAYVVERSGGLPPVAVTHQHGRVNVDEILELRGASR